MDPTLLLDLGIIMVVGTIIGCLAVRLRQPLILAYLVAGVIIGPICLGLVSNMGAIALFSELGVAFLLFAIGIESNFAKLLKMKHVIVIGALLQVAATTTVVFGLMQLFGVGFIESIYLGLILAFSSTVIVVKILSSKNQISTLHGQLIIGFAIVQDALVILLLPILQNMENILSFSLVFNFVASVLGLFLIAFILNKFVLRKLLGHFSAVPELFYLIVVSVAFIFIYFSYSLNFSIAVGAFIGGLSLSSLPYNLEAVSKIRGLRDFFATIFFVSLGMQIPLTFFSTHLGILLVMLLVVYIINPLIYVLIGLGFGYGARTSLLVGLALGQASEFSFILAQQGLKLGQITPNIYGLALFVIAISMASTPYMMEHSLKIYSFFDRNVDRFFPKVKKIYLNSRIKRLEHLPETESLKDHIVLIGTGVFGSGLVKELDRKGNLIVVDHNPNIVADFISKGIHAVYGGIDNEELLATLTLDKAKLIMVTVPDVPKVAEFIKKIKSVNKKVMIFCRAHYYEDALELYNAGADYVVLPQVIASNLFLKNTSAFLETGKFKHAFALRDEYMQFLREKAEEERKHFGF